MSKFARRHSQVSKGSDTQITSEARHILFWRYFPLGFSSIVCLLLGGIVSEFVQSLLPVSRGQSGLLQN